MMVLPRALERLTVGLSEVGLDTLRPERFRELIGDSFDALDPVIARARAQLEGRVVWHFNSTARGGGVAEMLRSYLAYVRGAGVDVRWMVVGGDSRFFELTKRIHNNLHGEPGDGGALGEAERRVYRSTLADATGELARLVRRGDIVFLHDPQTAGMVKPVHELGASVVWRCHVGVDRPNDLVRGAWDFLRPELDGADALVFSRQASSGTDWKDSGSGSSRRRSTLSLPRTRTWTLRPLPRCWARSASARTVRYPRRRTGETTEPRRASTARR